MRPRSRNSQTRGIDLSVDGHAVDGVKGFAHGFIESRVGVNGLQHRVDGGFGFHGRDGFRNKLLGLWPDDVDTKDFTKRLVGDDFHETAVRIEDGGLRVANEGELADANLEALRTRLRFSKANAADTRL